MIRAIYSNMTFSLDEIKEFLKENGIEFTEFNNTEGSEPELRIDMEEVDEDEKNILKEKFEEFFEDDLDDYTYIVFWS